MNTYKCLRALVIFLIIAGWIFSGWPQIWQEPPIPPEIQEVKATTERQSPDGLLQQDNLTGSLSDIDEDPDSPDGLWLTYIANNVDTVTRVSFPTPTGNPTIGASLQGFKIWVRKQPGTGTPTVSISLYENGALVAEIMAASSVTSATGQLFSATWNANLLSNADGSGVECYIFGDAVGGAPATRATVEVGAVEWNVNYTAAPTIAITRSAGDGILSYGMVNLNSSTSTDPAGINDVETFRNTGSVAEQFKIKTSTAVNGTTWTVTSGTPGTNTFRHSFTTTTVVTWQILDAAEGYEVASSSVAVNGNLNIYMKIETPSGTGGDYSTKTITITVFAEQAP